MGQVADIGFPLPNGASPPPDVAEHGLVQSQDEILAQNIATGTL